METDGRFDSGKCGKGLIFLITTGSIDTIEYRESLGISCFQGFLCILLYQFPYSDFSCDKFNHIYFHSPVKILSSIGLTVIENISPFPHFPESSLPSVSIILLIHFL